MSIAVLGTVYAYDVPGHSECYFIRTGGKTPIPMLPESLEPGLYINGNVDLKRPKRPYDEREIKRLPEGVELI